MQTGSNRIAVPTGPHGASPTPPPLHPSRPGVREISTAETLAAPTPPPLPPSSPGMVAPTVVRRGRRRWPMALAGVAALGAAGAIAYALIRPQPATPPPPIAPAIEAEPQKAVTPPPAAPAPETIALEFVVQPKDAKAAVWIDGKRVEGGMLESAKSDRVVAVKIEAKGYETFSGEYKLDRNQSVVVPLTKVAARGHDRGPRKEHAPDKTATPVGTKENKIVTDSPYAN
jgi:hypothetical protein